MTVALPRNKNLLSPSAFCTITRKILRAGERKLPVHDLLACNKATSVVHVKKFVLRTWNWRLLTSARDAGVWFLFARTSTSIGELTLNISFGIRRRNLKEMAEALVTDSVLWRQEKVRFASRRVSMTGRSVPWLHNEFSPSRRRTKVL